MPDSVNPKTTTANAANAGAKSAATANAGSGISIREACEADMQAIQAIYAHEVLTGSASFETDPPSKDTMLERFQAITDAGLPYWVADSNGTVAGYGYAGVYRTRYAYRFSVENSVYVHPDYRRRGIASLLLNSVIESCAAGGWKQMVAVIGDSENQSSIRLHEQCGFRLVGVLEKVGFKHERWIDTVLMQKQL